MQDWEQIGTMSDMSGTRALKNSPTEGSSALTESSALVRASPAGQQRGVVAKLSMYTRKLGATCYSILRILRPYCPGTDQHRRRYQKKIVAAARKRRERALVMNELGLSNDNVLRIRLRHFLNQLTAIEAWENTIARVSAFVLLAFGACLACSLSDGTERSGGQIC